MIITKGCPVFVQLNGIKEGEPVSTEILLDWQQQLDCGDAKTVSLSDFRCWEERTKQESRCCPSEHTHRLYSLTGGVFHVTLEEGVREFPEVRLPASMQALGALVEGVEAMRGMVSRLTLANRMLEAENTALKSRLGI